jgi:hypothetical protein
MAQANLKSEISELPWSEPEHQRMAELEGRRCQLWSKHRHPHHWFRFDDGTEVAYSEHCIDVKRSGKQVETILLGPMLLLALAQLGKFCLHASAFLWRGHVYLVGAPSGTGKSTFAASVAALGAQALTDDLSVVSLGAQGLVLWPHYPQLKWHRQLDATAPKSLPVHRFLALQRGAEAAIAELSPAEAVTRLVHSTVASQLFDATLLAKHLAFVAELAQARICSLATVQDLSSDPKLAYHAWLKCVS